MSLTGKTRVLGILGDPVAHSLSPSMQNRAIAEAGIDAVYVPFQVPAGQLAQAVAALPALGIEGVNVTVPHKEAVVALLDEVDPAARRIGAVNTIVNRRGRLMGYNTDGTGFLKALAEDLHFSASGCRILLLGAGGACRAALVSLALAGAAWIGIANRTRARAEALAEEFAGAFADTRIEVLDLSVDGLCAPLRQVDLLVNTTAVGLRGEQFEDLPWENLRSAAAVYDMVYRQNGTPLVKQALKRGHRAADGIAMLAGQGEEAFYLWFGQRPAPGLMTRWLRRQMDD